MSESPYCSGDFQDIMRKGESFNGRARKRDFVSQLKIVSETNADEADSSRSSELEDDSLNHMTSSLSLEFKDFSLPASGNNENNQNTNNRNSDLFDDVVKDGCNGFPVDNQIRKFGVGNGRDGEEAYLLDSDRKVAKTTEYRGAGKGISGVRKRKQEVGLFTKIKNWIIDSEICCILPDKTSVYEMEAEESDDGEAYGQFNNNNNNLNHKANQFRQHTKKLSKSANGKKRKGKMFLKALPEGSDIPSARIKTLVRTVSYLPNSVPNSSQTFTRVNNTFVDMGNHGDTTDIPSLFQENQHQPKESFFKAAKSFLLKHFSEKRTKVAPLFEKRDKSTKK